MIRKIRNDFRRSEINIFSIILIIIVLLIAKIIIIITLIIFYAVSTRNIYTKDKKEHYFQLNLTTGDIIL